MSPITTQFSVTGPAVQPSAPALQPGDTVLVTLAFDDPSKGRTSVAHKFNSQGQEINAEGAVVANGATLAFPQASPAASGPAPTLDLDALRARIEAGDIKGADALNQAFYAAYAAWNKQNVSLSGPDMIAATVYDFLGTRYNVKETDHQGPVLARSKVVARAVPNGTGTMYLVQLAPSWG